jgi:hypothetical protein
MVGIIKITEVSENRTSPLCSTGVVIGIDGDGIRSYSDEIYPFFQQRL